VIAEQGWADAGSYSDNDRSASRFATKDRPEWERLEADLARGRFDVLILWEPSRGSREAEMWFRLLNACRIHNVRIHITSHERIYDVENDRDWRTLADEGVNSASESNNISSRVGRGVRASAEAGKVHSQTAYGYVRIYDSLTAKFVEQRLSADAPIVRRIFNDVASGVPISTITNRLNAEYPQGPRGKGWARGTIRVIAENPIYIGKRRYTNKKTGQTQIIDGTWPAIVSEEVYYGAQEVLRSRADVTGKKTSRPGSQKYLLSYLATCSKCGEKLRANRSKNSASYGCPSGCVGIKMEWLDEYVSELLIDAMSQPAQFEAVAKPIDNPAVIAARVDVQRLEGELEECRRAAESGTVSLIMAGRVEAGLLARIAEAKVVAVQAVIPHALRTLVGSDGHKEGIRCRWATLPVAARRDVLRAAGACVVVKPVGSRGGSRASREYNVDAMEARVSVTWTGGIV
jgi:site-specific DNA recombinase